ncbi:ABC-2 type transport system ATP-binding protein [Proteiniborus ethanoligenes]|uniref:ABC-2 type transport system ATP-binding protein n=1 Tax=Proteiniborus ethanoligenes TaxID=415015 RepID=A0A1H3MVS5_9FIRM|nr:ABC transporter ATP-binding protein [Proteiniborus ethanoligenes]TAH62795.1 MAG: ABC transporter ATP-binding protein [Gottschalkiaceae bacterium]SDY80550.1 ABC-2 type transport system ATP-binding protein [Proteiniborus ethanoligenes]
MLEIKYLNKSYGDTKVLTDLSLELEENKVYGLLGRNGVGKTTLLSIIANQISKSSGEVKLYGEEVFENPKALENICMVREKGIGVEDIKVKKIFNMAKILYKDWDEDYKNFLIKEFNFNTNKKYNKLSRGNQTIVGLILGLASRSKLTIFDEPSLGLDAAHRYKFYNLLLKDIENYPRTIIISTHLIDEVTNLFEEVIILKDESVYIKDEVNNLIEKAYFLNGKEENIAPIIEGKRVIHKEEFGTSVIVGLFHRLTGEEKQRLKDNNIDISPMPLQKLFVYLTENSHVKEAL